MLYLILISLHRFKKCSWIRFLSSKHSNLICNRHFTFLPFKHNNKSIIEVLNGSLFYFNYSNRTTMNSLLKYNLEITVLLLEGKKLNINLFLMRAYTFWMFDRHCYAFTSRCKFRKGLDLKRIYVVSGSLEHHRPVEQWTFIIYMNIYNFIIRKI